MRKLTKIEVKNTVTKDEQLAKITDEYLSAFFGFAVNRLGNSLEAEELAQEIAFQAVKAVPVKALTRIFGA